MTDTAQSPTEPTKRTRRGRRRKTQAAPSSTESSQLPRPCRREGCPRLVRRSSSDYCTYVCGSIDKELERAQRVCQALGADTPLVADTWAEIVAVNDSWTRFTDLDRRVYRAALSAGITDEQWAAIKDGRGT